MGEEETKQMFLFFIIINSFFGYSNEAYEGRILIYTERIKTSNAISWSREQVMNNFVVIQGMF